jgi:hypothetical protein
MTTDGKKRKIDMTPENNERAAYIGLDKKLVPFDKLTKLLQKVNYVSSILLKEIVIVMINLNN